MSKFGWIGRKKTENFRMEMSDKLGLDPSAQKRDSQITNHPQNRETAASQLNAQQ